MEDTGFVQMFNDNTIFKSFRSKYERSIIYVSSDFHDLLDGECCIRVLTDKCVFGKYLNPTSTDFSMKTIIY